MLAKVSISPWSFCNRILLCLVQNVKTLGQYPPKATINIKITHGTLAL